MDRFSTTDPSGLSSISISADLANDVENIADGIFSPLEGFLLQEDFENVITKGRLFNDIPWTIPIVLDVDESTVSKIKDAGTVLLQNSDGVEEKNLKKRKVKGALGFEPRTYRSAVDCSTTELYTRVVEYCYNFTKELSNVHLHKSVLQLIN